MARWGEEPDCSSSLTIGTKALPLHCLCLAVCRHERSHRPMPWESRPADVQRHVGKHARQSPKPRVSHHNRLLRSRSRASNSGSLGFGSNNSDRESSVGSEAVTLHSQHTAAGDSLAAGQALPRTARQVANSVWYQRLDRHCCFISLVELLVAVMFAVRSVPKSSKPVRSVPATAIVAVSDDSLSQASRSQRMSPTSSRASNTSYGQRSRGRPNIKATHSAQDSPHERRLPWEVQPATLKNTVAQRRVGSKGSNT